MNDPQVYADCSQDVYAANIIARAKEELPDDFFPDDANAAQYILTVAAKNKGKIKLEKAKDSLILLAAVCLTSDSVRYVATAINSLGKLAWSFSGYFEDARVIVDLAAKLAEPEMEATSQACANALWGLGVLHLKYGCQIDCFDTLVAKFNSQRSRAIVVGFKQIAQAYAMFGRESPRELIEKLNRHKPRFSRQQRNIFAKLCEKIPAALTISKEVLVHGYFVDIYIKELNLVIEIDRGSDERIIQRQFDALHDEVLIRNFQVTVARIRTESTEDVDRYVDEILSVISKYSSEAVAPREGVELGSGGGAGGGSADDLRYPGTLFGGGAGAGSGAGAGRSSDIDSDDGGPLRLRPVRSRGQSHRPALSEQQVCSVM